MAADKRQIQITDLKALQPTTVDVTVEVDDDTILVVPMRTLSFARWQAIGYSVPDPLPPILNAKADGTVTYDWNNADYRRALNDASNQRALRRLVEMIAIDIPGDNEAAKVAYLEGLDNGVLAALVGAMGRLAQGGKHELKARAATFHPDRSDAGEGV